MSRQSEQTTTTEPSARRRSDTEQTIQCPSCGQTVHAGEMVTAVVGEMDREICQFCAATVFDEADPDAISHASHTPTQDSSARVETSWTPPQPRSTTGITGRLLQLHHLSLSVLWAIHQTNVHIFERILDEINVQQVAVLTIMMIGMVGLAGAVTP